MATTNMQATMLSLLHCKHGSMGSAFKFHKLPMLSFIQRRSKALRTMHCTATEAARGSIVSPASKLAGDERMNALKEFDDTKGGVKGLLDSGIKKIPSIFVCPPEPSVRNSNLRVPVIDLEGFEGERRDEIVEEIGKAMESWGIFYIVNHGIPIDVMKTLLQRTKEFHELPKETKLEYYSRDNARSMKYYATVDLYDTKIAQWKDTLSCEFANEQFALEDCPQLCGKAIEEYMNRLVKLIKEVVSPLLSEALGLDRQHLASIGGFESQRLVCHYYPSCPEPHLTQGVLKHTDPYFLTVGLQDQLGGLQVLHENQWVDVTPIDGALDVNAGDFLQLVTNDKFKSPVHRVVAQEIGPRMATPCFFLPSGDKLYAPIEELLSEDNPPKYRRTSSYEYDPEPALSRCGMCDRSGPPNFRTAIRWNAFPVLCFSGDTIYWLWQS